MSARRLSLTLIATAVLLTVATAAWAYWTAVASGSGSATTGTLSAPSDVVAAAGIGSVDVSWTAATLSTGDPATSYSVSRVPADGGAAVPACSATSPTTTSCTDSGVPDGSYHYVVTAAYRGWTAVSDASNQVTVVNDALAPAVTAITRTGDSPTNAAAVQWSVTFSEPVTGVDPTDFALAESGVTGAAVTDVTGGGEAYTVTVSTGTGSGSLRLDLGDDDTIRDSAGNPLGGSGDGAGLAGETYTIDRDQPGAAVEQNAGQADPTNSLPIRWSVTFTEPVTGFDTTDLVRSGTATGGLVSLSGSGEAYEIVLTGPLTDGTVAFSVAANAARDAAGNLSATSTSTDGTVTYDTSPPAVVVTSTTNPVNNANKANTEASGTGESGAVIRVVASDPTGHSSLAVTTTAVAGVWTATGINVTGLDDGSITYTATAVDAAGNEATAIRTTTKDTVAPAVTVSAVTDPIKNTNKANTSASGTVEAGAAVTVVAATGGTSTAPVTAAGSGTAWDVSGLNVTQLSDGTVTYTATATDAAGNTATATRTAVKDTRTRFVVSAAPAQTAGTAFPVNISVLNIVDDSADTTYTGTKTISFAGPASSPSLAAPSYPATVSFGNGVGSASVTLKRAETVALTATEGATTGRSDSITVAPGAASNLAWTDLSNLPSPPAPPCLFLCTVEFGNLKNVVSGYVMATDAFGNLVSDLSGGVTVTLTRTGSGTSTPATLTIPSTGPARSTGSFSFTPPGGNANWSATLKAMAAGYTEAAATFRK